MDAADSRSFNDEISLSMMNNFVTARVCPWARVQLVMSRGQLWVQAS
jgi:hypothetical protein